MKKDLTFLMTFMLLLVSFFAFQETLTGRITHVCTDSDQGDYFVKGTATAGDEELEDACEKDMLLEYFCGKTGLQVKVYPCPEGCEKGACKKPTTIKPKETIKLGDARNQIEIKEYLGDVVDTLTAQDTKALLGGKISTKEGATDYTQYLRFKTDDLLSGRILFTENDENQVADFLVFAEDNDTFEYELSFGQGLASEIKSNQLEDLIDEKLFMLGREYVITDAEKNGNRVSLTVVSGPVIATMREGEEKTYLMNGKEYAIKVMSIDDQARKAMFSINDKITSQLGVGDLSSDEILLAVTAMSVSEAAEQEDQVTVVLGADKIEWTDSNVADDVFSQTISINGKGISNGYVKIKGTGDSDEYKITSLKYRYRAESKTGSDIYVPANKGLKDQLRYPQALLGDWDILYGGLPIKKSIMKFDPHSSAYQLEFTNKKQQRYDIPLVANVNGNLKIGDDDNTLHFIETASSSTFNVTQQDFIILTSTNDRTGITNILRYTSINTADKTLFFDDLAEGKKEVKYSGAEGTDAIANLVVSGNMYRVYIGGSPDYKLAMDLNHDGDVNSDEVNIVVEGGGLLDLGSAQTPNDNFNMTLTTQAKQFDTPSADENILISVTKSGGSIDLDLPAQSSITIESKAGKKLAMSNYGVALKQELDNPDELMIHYPLQQAVGQIDIVFREQQKEMIQAKSPEKKQESSVSKKEESLQPIKEQKEISKQPVVQEQPTKTYEQKPTGFRAWIKNLYTMIRSWFR